MPTRVIAVFRGTGAELGEGERVRTGYRKQRVECRVRVRRAGLDGDEQVHSDVHGGVDRAVLAYAARQYDTWKSEGISLALGAFAENLVIDGLDDETVCLGDEFRIGTARLEVSVPRTPCGMIERATGVEGLFERVRATGRAGWLHRVLDEGEVCEGDVVIACGRKHPEWPVTRVAYVMDRLREGDRSVVEDARVLADVQALAARWREKLRERIAETKR